MSQRRCVWRVIESSGFGFRSTRRDSAAEQTTGGKLEFPAPQSLLISGGLEGVRNDLPSQVIESGAEIVYGIANEEWVIIRERDEVDDSQGCVTKVVIELGFNPVHLFSVELHLPLPLVGASITGFYVLSGPLELEAATVQSSSHKELVHHE